jgi:ADP-ribose pyrophosphatase YjhB (NUDIX family)
VVSVGALREAVRVIGTAVTDPRTSLPEDLFLLISRLIPMVNVDLLLADDQGRILLTWRDDRHFGRGWHLPGGMVRFKESARERVEICAWEELRARVAPSQGPVSTHEVMRKDGDERGHFLSLLYGCRLLTPPEPKLGWQSGDPRRGEWAWHSACPDDLIPIQEHYRHLFASQTAQASRFVKSRQ